MNGSLDRAHNPSSSSRGRKSTRTMRWTSGWGRFAAVPGPCGGCDGPVPYRSRTLWNPAPRGTYASYNYTSGRTRLGAPSTLSVRRSPRAASGTPEVVARA